MLSNILPLKKLGNPVFLIALLALILNDWVLKHTFNNELTGKLSDFTGLFAFAFFLSIWFPKKLKEVHLLTAIGFIFLEIGTFNFSDPFTE